MITKIKNTIELLQKEITSLEGQERLLNTQIEEDMIELKSIKINRENFKQSIEILDLAQKQIRSVIKSGFQSVVTNALQTIFGKDFYFELEFGRRGNLQEAYFTIKNNTLKNSHNPIDVLAGGGKDIISLSLRTVILELFQKKNKSPLIADEPLKFVSPEFINSAGMFIQTLNEKMSRQIIIVTHKEGLKEFADNVIDVENLHNKKF